MILGALLALIGPGPLPVADRLAARNFPSICADGASADRLCAYDGRQTALAEAPMSTLARHDLIIMPVEKLGLRWSGAFPGAVKSLDHASVVAARKWRTDLAKLNPNAIVLAEIPYFDAPVSFLPLSSPLWRRKPDGHVDMSVGVATSRGKLKFESAAFRKLFEERVRALKSTGVIDGVELKAWEVDSPDRLGVVQAARRGVGKEGLIVLEIGLNEPTLSATYVNGVVMGGFGNGWTEHRDSVRISKWVESHTRKPNFTVLEGSASKDRTHLYEMRAVTALDLTLPNSFVTFADASGHDWYDFWARTLGKPVGTSYMKNGAIWRDFENGTVIFNPVTDNSITADFPSLRTSEAKSLSLHRVSIQPGDGDILLSKTPVR